MELRSHARISNDSFWRRRHGHTPPIDRALHPRGFATLEPVDINGTDQWVLIRSEDAANPVVLFLHGGPGTSQLTLMRRNTQPLEKNFTVVNWDQRLAGKSFAAGRDHEKLKIRQYVDDVIELSTYLTRRFGKRKIVLAGHSWGSVIGILAAAERPDLFSAYVGIGQMSRMLESERLSYAWTLDRASRADDERSVRKLHEMGPPPYTGDWRSKFLTQRRILGKYGGEFFGSRIGAFGVVVKNLIFSTEYTLADRFNYFRGILQSSEAIMPELLQVDLFKRAPELRVPVFFCLGRHDHEVPSTLSARYFQALKAPKKRLVWFERSAHMPNTEEREKFNRFMIDEVLPVSRDDVGATTERPTRHA